MRTLDRFQPRCSVVAVRDTDAIGFEHRGVNVLTGEVGIGPEHIGTDVAPHHELDHALRDLLLDQVRNPAVAEDMRRDVLADPGSLRDTLEPLVDGRMNEGFAAFVHKDQPLPVRVRFVASPPLCQIFPGHDEPDVPGHVGLEVHVRDDAIFIEREIAPGHGPDLANPEPAFVEHHDERPIHGPGARFHHRGDLVRCQQISSDLGHGVLGGRPEFMDLAFGQRGILVLDHPEVKLFEDGDEVADGVLLEWLLTAALCISQLWDCCVQVTDGVVSIRPDEPAPGNQREGELVRPPRADVLAGPEFCNKFPDLGGIDRRDGEVQKGGLDCVFCQICPDRMK